MDKKFELYTVYYQTLKFGTEDEYLPMEHLYLVCTAGGRKDAKKACEKYHPKCKVTAVLNRLEEATGIHKRITK